VDMFSCDDGLVPLYVRYLLCCLYDLQIYSFELIYNLTLFVTARMSFIKLTFHYLFYNK
jgi:hypothetical protein